MNKTDNNTKAAATSHDAKNYRDNWIDPMEIFGVSEAVERAVDTGNLANIIDHPDFPNPRSTMDLELIKEIVANGDIDCPVQLFFTKDGSIIPIDGKTRLTAIAEYIARNPDRAKFKRIQYVRVKGDETNARFLAIRLNLGENAKPLSEIEVAVAIQRFIKAGFNAEEISEKFGKGGRGGKQWVTKYIDIYNANPKVIEAFEKGELDGSTAVAISRQVDFKEQESAVGQAIKKKASGKSEKEVRREIGVRNASRTTMSFPNVMELVGESLPDFVTILKKIDDGVFPELEAVSALSKEQIADYIGENNVLERMRVLAKVLKISDKTVKEQLTFMVENCSDEAIMLVPKIKFSKDFSVLKDTTW